MTIGFPSPRRAFVSVGDAYRNKRIYPSARHEKRHGTSTNPRTRTKQSADSQRAHFTVPIQIHCGPSPRLVPLFPLQLRLCCQTGADTRLVSPVTATMAATADFAPPGPMRLSPMLSDASLDSLLLWMASQVVGQCAVWIARIPPLRAPSGRGHPAMRFGGLAWLAHRGGCPQGCAHTESASSGCNEQ